MCFLSSILIPYQPDLENPEPEEKLELEKLDELEKLELLPKLLEELLKEALRAAAAAAAAALAFWASFVSPLCNSRIAAPCELIALFLASA